MDERRQSKGDKVEATGPRNHTISAAEVREWFGTAARPQPSDAQCDEIAGFVTNIRWAHDPFPPESDLEKDETFDDDRWWDIPGATDAAKLLLASVPKMLAIFEDRPEWLREGPNKLHDAFEALHKANALDEVQYEIQKARRQAKHDALKAFHQARYDAIKALHEALTVAVPYIEWPFSGSTSGGPVTHPRRTGTCPRSRSPARF